MKLVMVIIILVFSLPHLQVTTNFSLSVKRLIKVSIKLFKILSSLQKRELNVTLQVRCLRCEVKVLLLFDLMSSTIIMIASLEKPIDIVLQDLDIKLLVVLNVFKYSIKESDH